MASLYNNKISTTYVGLIKTIDNAVISASLRELTDGSGNATGIHLNNAGDFKVTSILEFGSLKDTGENITITKFVDEADGIASNDNDTTIPTSAAVVDYVASRITLEDLDFSGDSGTGSVDLDSQVFAIVGTANEIETSGGSQQLQIGLPDNVTITGNLQVNGLLKGNNNIVIKDTSDRTMAAFYGGGKTELYFNDSKKFETTGDGATVTGGLTATGGSVFTGATFSSDVDFADNAKARFGAGNDLEIYHDGTNNFIKSVTSTLYIKNEQDDGDIIFESDDGSGNIAEYFRVDGAFTKTIFSKDIWAQDNVKALFGTSSDLQIYHNGSHSFIQDTGTGDLRLLGSLIRLQSEAEENMLRAETNAGVYLYYDNVVKFETTSAGSKVTGNLEVTGTITGSGGSFLPLAGGTMTGNTIHNDNVKSIYGTASDGLEIYHNGSNSFISDTGTGLLVLSTNTLQVYNAAVSEFMITATENGSVDLYYDNSKKFETTNTGAIVTGSLTLSGGSLSVGADVTLADNGKIKLGSSADLEIYHDSSSSFIKNSTGNLNIQEIAGGSIFFEKTDGENMAVFRTDAECELYYNGTETFATTSTGVSVTGVTDTDGITSSAEIAVTDGDVKIIRTNNTDSVLTLNSNSSALGTTYQWNLVQTSSATSYAFQIREGSTPYLTINNSAGGNAGNVTFAQSVTISGDLTVNGTTTTVNTSTLAVEDPLISMAKDNSANSVDIGFYGRYNDGSNRYLGLFSNASDSNKFILFKGLTEEPTTTVNVSGTGFTRADLQINELETSGSITMTSASSPTLTITDTSQTTTLKAFAQDSNAHIGTWTNHAFVLDSNSTTALTLDTSQNATFAGNLSLTDSKYLYIGASNDLQLYHDGTDSYISNTQNEGDLIIQNGANDKDIIFKCDDGNGSLKEYFKLDGSSADGTYTYTKWVDGGVITFGGDEDLRIWHDPSNSCGYIRNYTNHLYIENTGNDSDIIFKSDDGSGGTAEYYKIDGGSVLNIFYKDVFLGDNVKSLYGDSSDLKIYHDGSASNIVNETGNLLIEQKADDGDIIFYSDDGSGNVTQYFRVDGGAGETFFSRNTRHLDSVYAQFGTATDLKIYHDGSNAYIKNDTGNLIIDAAVDIALDADGGDIYLKDGGTEFGRLSNVSNDFVIYSAISDEDILFKGNDGGSTITALTLDMSAAGYATFNSGIQATNTYFTGTMNVASPIYHIGDADTYFGFSANDTFVVNTAGANRLTIDSTGHSNFNKYIKLDDPSEDATGRQIHFVAITGESNTEPFRITRWGDKMYFTYGDNSGDESFWVNSDGTVNFEEDVYVNQIQARTSAGLKLGNDNNSGYVFVKDSGEVCVGTTTPSSNANYGTGDFNVENNVFASAQIMSHNSTAGNYSFLGLGKSSGTGASPTIVQAQETVGAINFYGYDGAAYLRTAGILSDVDGTPGTNDMPGRLEFWTTSDGASNPTERMRIDSAGNVGIGTDSPTRLLTLENDTATVTNNAQLRINNVGAGDAYIYLYAGSDWSLGVDNSDSDKFKICHSNDVSDETGAIEIDTSSNVTVQGAIYGKSYTQTSSDSTYSIIDTSVAVAPGVYEVFYIGNPNDGGSSAYRAVTTGMIIITVDYSAPNVVNEIRFVQTSITGGGSSDIDLVVSAKILQGGTEYDELNVSTSGQTIRVKISGYAGTKGDSGQLRLTRKL